MFFLQRMIFVWDRSMTTISWKLIAVAYLLTYWSMKAMLNWAGEFHLTVHFFYFYTVVSSTTGLGDLAPKSPEGRYIFAFYLWIVIGQSTVMVSKVLHILEVKRERRRQGMGSYVGKKHVVILTSGYNSDIRDLINQIRADERRKDQDIVVCCSEGTDRPVDLAKDIDFYSGDLTKKETMGRVSALTAQDFIVWGDDDSLTIHICAVVRCHNHTAQLLAVIKDHENEEDIIASGPDCCRGLNSALRGAIAERLAQALGDRGSDDFLRGVFSNEGQTYYTLTLEDDVSVEEADQKVRACGGIFVAAQVDGMTVINPQANTLDLKKDAWIAFIAAKPFTYQEVFVQ